jgi:hypothetical protein
VTKSKAMAFKEGYPVREKITTEDKTLVQVSNFKYLVYDVPFLELTDIKV